jgi:quinol monooxygenase YgiN
MCSVTLWYHWAVTASAMAICARKMRFSKLDDVNQAAAWRSDTDSCGLAHLVQGHVGCKRLCLGVRIVARRFLILCGTMMVVAILGTLKNATSETMERPLVRIAELEIDAAQLPAYRNALKEEIANSIRVEPGVLTLYAVSVKDNPTQIRIFETYKDQEAYEAHLQTPHFKKYKTETQGMVKSLRLIETEPILLGAK